MQTLGRSDAGFEENFALASLHIGDGATHGRVQLVSAFDNLAATTETRYVRERVLGAGSELDLNGRTLFYRDFIDHGGMVIRGAGSS